MHFNWQVFKASLLGRPNAVIALGDSGDAISVHPNEDRLPQAPIVAPFTHGGSQLLNLAGILRVSARRDAGVFPEVTG